MKDIDALVNWIIQNQKIIEILIIVSLFNAISCKETMKGYRDFSAILCIFLITIQDIFKNSMLFIVSVSLIYMLTNILIMFIKPEKKYKNSEAEFKISTMTLEIENLQQELLNKEKEIDELLQIKEKSYREVCAYIQLLINNAEMMGKVETQDKFIRVCKILQNKYRNPTETINVETNIFDELKTVNDCKKAKVIFEQMRKDFKLTSKTDRLMRYLIENLEYRIRVLSQERR